MHPEYSSSRRHYITVIYIYNKTQFNMFAFIVQIFQVAKYFANSNQYIFEAPQHNEVTNTSFLLLLKQQGQNVPFYVDAQYKITETLFQKVLSVL